MTSGAPAPVPGAAAPPDVDARLVDVPVAAIDFETTGLGHARGDRVIEVAVVRGRYGETPEMWTTLVHPERRVAATHIHGITDAMLAGTAPFAAIADGLMRRLQGAVVVAHNAPFDRAFLEMELERAGWPVPAMPWLDTLGLARRVLALGDHRLSSLCDRLGIARTRAHRALDDARATWELAFRLAHAADPTGDLRLGHALLLCRRRSPEEVEEVLVRLEGARRAGRALVVDYLSGDAPDQPPTRRTISVAKVTRSRVVAWCHLRAAERTFRVDRLRIVDEVPTPPREG